MFQPRVAFFGGRRIVPRLAGSAAGGRDCPRNRGTAGMGQSGPYFPIAAERASVGPPLTASAPGRTQAISSLVAHTALVVCCARRGVQCPGVAPVQGGQHWLTRRS